MNILITGATGFVGRHLVRKLKKDFSLHLLLGKVGFDRLRRYTGLLF